MNAFQRGYVYGLWKLGFSEEFAAAQPPMSHEEFLAAKGATTPPKGVSAAAKSEAGKAAKGGKGLAHHGRQLGATIAKHPGKAALIGGAGLLGAGLLGRATA